MSHKHANLMRSIFQDPPSANIHWREIESLLLHLGADVEPSHGARFKITLNKVEAFLHHPHNSSTCSTPGNRALRHRLTPTRDTLSSYEAHESETRPAVDRQVTRIGPTPAKQREQQKADFSRLNTNSILIG